MTSCSIPQIIFQMFGCYLYIYIYLLEHAIEILLLNFFICKAPESPLGACHPMVNLDSNLQIETSSKDSWTNKNTMAIGFVSAIFITLLPSTSFLATKWRSLSFNGRTGISSGFESHVHKRVKSCWNQSFLNLINSKVQSLIYSIIMYHCIVDSFTFFVPNDVN